jgi:bifunctional pyridoxal-dependent enzyme with beta-cystathionase and maltose regulon repressor activities
MMSSPFDRPTIESRLAARGAKWHRDPEDVIPLWLADPDYPLCPEIKEALRGAVEEEFTVYSPSTSVLELMAAKISRYNGFEVPAEQIMLTQGIIPGMWLAAEHACRPGDEVIVTDPMYYPFFMEVDRTRTRPVHWKLKREEGYRFDIERLKSLVSPKTRLIYVCNPHNPCGRVMTREELKGIADVAVDEGIYVYVDELWEDILNDGRKHISLASLNPEIADLTITSWGFSKTWSVPGLQAGYLAANSKTIFDNLTNISRGVLRGTNNFSKAIAEPILSGKVDYWVREMNAYLQEMRDLVEKRLKEMGDFTIPKLEGTYLMFPKFNYGLGGDELEKFLMEEAKVTLNNGNRFGPEGEGHMRMLTATSKGIMNEALDRIERVIPKLEKMRK